MGFFWHLQMSVVVIIVVFAFFITGNNIFIFVNEIQTDGGKRSYRQR